MLPDETLPDGLGELLKACRSCFSARSFPIFCLLTVGMIAQVGSATVTGMLLGAGIQRVVGHDRVHRFFSEHHWSTDQLGLCLARIIVTRLLPADAAITVLVDDTLFRRRGRKVAQSYFGHDASQPGRPFARGNRWVIAGIVVTLPGMTRPVCLPVLLRLWQGKGTASCVDLARGLIGLLLRAFPDQNLHVVGDGAYHGGALTSLPQRATITTRVARNAALYAPAPPPTHRRGRPRTKGDRLGTPEQVRTTAPARKASVQRYGKTAILTLTDTACLWYGAFNSRPGRLITAVDDTARRLAVLHVFTTDLHSPPEDIIARYSTRWKIETMIENAKQAIGVGQARNRVTAAVERTVPFGMLVMTIVQLWYGLHGHESGDLAACRAARPWYTTKTEPSFTDMLAKLRRAIIKARFSAVYAGQHPTPQIDHDTLTWIHTAA